MRLHRVFPWDPAARPSERGGPLHVPRRKQGGGRHDNPDAYGALYLSEDPVAAVAETLRHLTNQALLDLDLERAGRRLALVPLDARLDRELWDLDEPAVLVKRRLHPSQVATLHREVTQRWALQLFRARPRRDGIRWWSTLEASWLHVTLFDRALPRLTPAGEPEPLRLGHSAVRAAAEAIGARIEGRRQKRSAAVGARKR